MSVLTLIRHGQAAAFQKESDRLTDLGERQAEVLASYWLKYGVSFDEVYSGTLVRQVRTEQVVAKSYEAAGVSWPDPIREAGFNEYDATGVLHRLAPALAERDQRFEALLRAFDEARESPDRNRPFQRLLEVAMAAWLRGFEVPGVEPWPTFRDRVRGALRQLMSRPGSRRVALFTSGGPIGLVVQTALQAPDPTFLEVNWRVRNCSLTEFIFSGDRISLDSFNGIPHLEDRSQWTYR